MRFPVDLFVLVLVDENGTSRGMNPIARTISGVGGKTFRYRFSRGDMVTIGEVWQSRRLEKDVGFQIVDMLTIDNISFLAFLLYQVRRIEISVDEPDFGILACNLGTFGTVADEAGDLPVRVGMVYGVKSISTNVAGRTSPANALVRARCGTVVEPT